MTLATLHRYCHMANSGRVLIVSEAVASSRELLTVDELAAAAGVPVRTIRFYTGKRLLAPPFLAGRTGLYDAGHLATLELIRDLQGHGFSLATVEAILQRLPEDPTPEDIELFGSLVAPWPVEETEVLTHEQWRERFGFDLDPDNVPVLEAAGLLDAVGPEKVQAPRRVLEMLDQVAEIDPPPDMLADAARIVGETTAQLATNLTELFRERMITPDRRARTDEERERLRASADVLRRLTVQLLSTSFQRAIARLLADRARGGGS